MKSILFGVLCVLFVGCGGDRKITIKKTDLQERVERYGEENPGPCGQTISFRNPRPVFLEGRLGIALDVRVAGHTNTGTLIAEGSLTYIPMDFTVYLVKTTVTGVVMEGVAVDRIARAYTEAHRIFAVFTLSPEDGKEMGDRIISGVAVHEDYVDVYMDD